MTIINTFYLRRLIGAVIFLFICAILLPICFDGKKVTYPNKEPKVKLFSSDNNQSSLEAEDTEQTQQSLSEIAQGNVQENIQDNVSIEDSLDTLTLSTSTSPSALTASGNLLKNDLSINSSSENKLSNSDRAKVDNMTTTESNSNISDTKVKKEIPSIWDSLDKEILKETAGIDNTKTGNDASWVIQVGVFSNPANATNLVARLKQAKYKAFTRKQGELVRVMVGPDVSKEHLLQQIDGVQSVARVSGAKVIRLIPE